MDSVAIQLPDKVTTALNNPELKNGVFSHEISFALNEAIMNLDIAKASAILSTFDDINALAEGLRFDDLWREKLLMKTPDRQDGDVITMKAIAQSVLDTNNTNKLASVMTVSTLFRHDNILEAELRNVLGDLELQRAILFADPTRQFLPEEDIAEPISSNPQAGRRRLTCDGCTPVNSWVCSHCWARDVCVKFIWCKQAAEESRRKKKQKKKGN